MNYSCVSDSILTHNFENVFIIGRSRLNKPLYCIPLGKGRKRAVFAAAFHGLEYLTAEALTGFALAFSKMHEYHSAIRVFVIPKVNPDGTEIAINGLNPQNKYHKEIIRNTGIIDFRNSWQSNAAGVDINHNFNADWDPILTAPAPTKYGGHFPESEPETHAVARFLRKCKPDLFAAFHSQGKEIYYDFNGMENKRAKKTAEAAARRAGYTVSIPEGTAAFGGAKDWYIKEFHKQAFTIELGIGKNPLPREQLPEMTADTIKICLAMIDEILK